MLGEAMLACAGVINRMGTIAAGSTVSDYHDSEKHRQISVSASLLHLEWLNKKFNVIDCPGYADFISEGLGALRVGDFALVVVHANHGVGVGTDAVWKYATQYGIPKMIVVNAFDKDESDFEKVLGQIREHFGDRVFPLTIPVNPGPGFNQVLDVLRSEIITFAGDKSGKFTEAPATGEWAARVEQLHKQLIEFIAESDDTLLEKFFAQGSLSEEEMRGGIHAAVQNQSFVPLFAVSAENNIGVARLMDFIAKYGSSPVDRAKVRAVNGEGKEVELSLTDPDPVCYVFKTMSEAQFGELSFFRIYSGSIKFGSELYNTDRRSTEKIGQIYILNGKTRTSVPTLGAGDIYALGDQLLAELVYGEIGAESRNGFQLVQCPTSMAQGAPRDHWNRHAGRSCKRSRDQAGLVANAASGVLVRLRKADRREVGHFARPNHGGGKERRLPRGHPFQEDGHQEGAQLVVRPRAVR